MTALRRELEQVTADRDRLLEQLARPGRNDRTETEALADVGIYQYRHPLENAAQYREQLKSIQERIRQMVRDRLAIGASDRFAYNNSLAQGRRMVDDFSKLMLRAYNAEAENCVRTVRAGSVSAAVARLERAVAAIQKQGRFMDMHVTEAFHALRVEEIELTADYLMKVQEEREAEREHRAQLREQRRAEAELAAERQRLEKERNHYRNALEALQAQNKVDDTRELVEHLAQLDAAIQDNDYRAANIRAGYVYVISNIGAFGPNVVKIGMTRRLEPLDRVRELGDASVPFPFDVHLIHFSDDAVSIESQLHQAFAEGRLNRVNLRREFFHATPAEVRDVLTTKFGDVLEFIDEPEALQYRQSRSRNGQDQNP